MNKKDNQQALLIANQLTKIVDDCLIIIKKTTNPNTYFSRFDLLINKLIDLSKLEGYDIFIDILPSTRLHQILELQELMLNEFCKRYYKKFNQEFTQQEIIKYQKEYFSFYERNDYKF